MQHLSLLWRSVLRRRTGRSISANRARRGSDSYGDFDFQRDRSALFRDRPINVFQVKASYWLGI